MTQLFADDERVVTALPGLPVLPVQRPADLAPAMTAGKGVRAVSCVGCRRDTLPRPDDNAPLCGRCSEVLEEAARPLLSLGRWRRWRGTGFPTA